MVGMNPEVAMHLMNMGVAAKNRPLDQEYKQALIDQIRSAIPRHGQELNLKELQLQRSIQHDADTLKLNRDQLQLHREQFGEQRDMNKALKEGRLEAAREHRVKMEEIVNKRIALEQLNGVAIDVQGKKVPLGTLERIYPGAISTILKHQYKETEGTGGITISDLSRIQGDILREWAIPGDQVDANGMPTNGQTILDRKKKEAQFNPEIQDKLEVFDSASKLSGELLKAGTHKLKNAPKLGGSSGVVPMESEAAPSSGKKVRIPKTPSPGIGWIFRENKKTGQAGWVSPDGAQVVIEP